MRTSGVRCRRRVCGASMGTPTAAKSRMRPTAVELPRREVERTRMPRFACHCLTVKAMIRVKSVVVVKMPVVKIVVEMMEVVLKT